MKSHKCYANPVIPKIHSKIPHTKRCSSVYEVKIPINNSRGKVAMCICVATAIFGFGFIISGVSNSVHESLIYIGVLSFSVSTVSMIILCANFGFGKTYILVTEYDPSKCNCQISEETFAAMKKGLAHTNPKSILKNVNKPIDSFHEEDIAAMKKGFGPVTFQTKAASCESSSKHFRNPSQSEFLNRQTVNSYSLKPRDQHIPQRVDNVSSIHGNMIENNQYQVFEASKHKVRLYKDFFIKTCCVKNCDCDLPKSTPKRYRKNRLNTSSNTNKFESQNFPEFKVEKLDIENWLNSSKTASMK